MTELPTTATLTFIGLDCLLVSADGTADSLTETAYANGVRFTLHPNANHLLQQINLGQTLLITELTQVTLMQIGELLELPLEKFRHCLTLVPTSQPKDAATVLLDLLAEGRAGPLSRIFFLSGSPNLMQAGALVRKNFELRQAKCQVIPIGLKQETNSAVTLEAAGARFVAADHFEAVALMQSSKSAHSISWVIMAYNEEATMVTLIEELRLLGKLYFNDYQIIVVDDGSSDATALRVEEQIAPDIILCRHHRNLGMGAVMKTGYQQATKDYVVAVAADRQVRGHSVVAFLPHLKKNRVVLSKYPTYHSSWMRGMISWLFRLCLKWVGGLRVDFAGVYLFPREALRKIKYLELPAKTFVYSFEFLNELHRSGYEFHYLIIKPFLRDHGRSRAFSLPRIGKVFSEIVRGRFNRFAS